MTIVYDSRGVPKVNGGGGGAADGFNRIAAGTQTAGTSATIKFADSNGISFGMSNSTQITASYTVPSIAGLISAVFLSAGTTNTNASAFTFSNSNGISFGLNGQTLTASHNGLTSQSNQAFSAQGGSSAFQTLNFANSNGVTFSNSNGSVVASYTVPSTAGLISAVNVSAGTTSNNLTAFTFNNANGVSFGLNGSTITASVNAEGGQTYSGYNPYPDREYLVSAVGQASLMFEPEQIPNVQFDRFIFPLQHSNATNSSGSHTLSFWIGLYTRNASTLSLLQSASGSTAITCSGTVGSYSLFSGMRNFSIPFTTTLTDGQYWIGFLSRTTSGGANATYSNYVISNIASNFVGNFGVSHNTTIQRTLGQGFYSTTTSAMPASVAFSQINGSNSIALRPPVLMLASSTV